MRWRLSTWVTAFLLLPLLGQAAVPVPPSVARQQLKINVPGQIRGSFYAYPKDNPRLTLQRILGRGPRARDVVQGELNDCFFVGTLGAIAHAQPQHIEQLFVTDGRGHIQLDEQGRASVRLYRKGKRETVKVSAALVYGPNGKARFTQPAKGKLWAPLLEMAYATMLSNHARRKGLTTINQGGAPEDVIYALTGQRAGYRDLAANRAGVDETWRLLKETTERGSIVVAGTVSGKREMKIRLGELLETGVLGGWARRMTLGGQRMISDHDQSVLGVVERDGQRLVKIRNPWGSFVPRGSGRHSGEYELPIEKFMVFFDGVTYSRG